LLSTKVETIKALAILRCLYGSEMVLAVRSGDWYSKCEMPSTDISQENNRKLNRYSGIGLYNNNPSDKRSIERLVRIM
jgi:hypothetical protein